TMPIYEYYCPLCGMNIEEIQKFSDPPLTLCPKCGKNSLQKKVSLAGFQLKGSGWYVTDFKDDKKTAPKTEDKIDKADRGGDKTDKADKNGGASSAPAEKPAEKKKSTEE